MNSDLQEKLETTQNEPVELDYPDDYQIEDLDFNEQSQASIQPIETPPSEVAALVYNQSGSVNQPFPPQPAP